MPDDWGDEVMSNVFVRDPNCCAACSRKPRATSPTAAARSARTRGAPHTGPRRARWRPRPTSTTARARHTRSSRPPGHHARRDAAGGFCYLNNAAIAAQSLLGRHRRVAILDTDMHHGQGVQEIFYGRDDVLYVSIHGDPTTSTRSSRATRKRRARGRRRLQPQPADAARCAGVGVLRAARRRCARARAVPARCTRARARLRYLQGRSASQVAVTTDGFGRLGGAIGALGLPTVIVQEGGYHLDSLDANARAFFGGFAAAR